VTMKTKREVCNIRPPTVKRLRLLRSQRHQLNANPLPTIHQSSNKLVPGKDKTSFPRYDGLQDQSKEYFLIRTP